MKVIPLAITLVALVTVSVGQSTDAKTAKRAAGKSLSTESARTDDVVVKKNADGTVEVSDNDGQPAAVENRGGGITYKAAPPATIKYGDGVVVHRNADGSVDVEDEDSAHPVYHSFGSAPAPRYHATKRGAHHTTAKTSSKKPK